MKREKRVNTVEAKNRFNELIAKAERTKQPIIVEKRGSPVAVVIDYASYRKKIGRPANSPAGKIVVALETLHHFLRAKYPSGTGDSAEILHEVRRQRSLL
ncbi:MAG: type II toxin-antitoxin system Phd/YefM family antitoxin [Deltaproteobacteria bacterium]|nr:type II toxin-antitoxin system Phd/YefM family antitoxin [Deltaproteobacteria bacterium]